jgi:hypothetical protein
MKNGRLGEKKSQYLNCTIISQLIWGSIHIMKVMYEQRQQQLQQSILSYVVCQLSSTPADQNHITSVRDVNYHWLTHICIISPILQKIVSNIRCIERINLFKLQNIWITCYITNNGVYESVFDFVLTFRRLRKFAKSDYWFRLCVSVGPFVSIKQLGPQREKFLNMNTWEFVKHLLRKLNFTEGLTIITCTLHEDACSRMVMSRSFLLTINGSDKVCILKHIMHFIFKNIFEKVPLWDNVWKYGVAREITDVSAIFFFFLTYWKAATILRFKYNYMYIYIYIYIYIYEYIYVHIY